jgi:hypothetical protein
MLIDEIQVMENRLSQWANRIDSLSREIESANPKLRETYRTELRELERKRFEAERHLAQLRIASAESYEKEDIQAAVLSIFDDIGRRLDRLISPPQPT